SKPRRPARLGARGARLGRAEMAADDGEDFDDLDALEQDGPGRLGPRPRRLRRHRGGGRGGRRRGPGRRPRRRRGAGEPAGPPRYEVGQLLELRCGEDRLVGALPSGARGRYRGWAHVRRADAGRAGAVAGEGGASCGPPRACERPPEGRALAGDCSPRPAGRSQEGRELGTGRALLWPATSAPRSRAPRNEKSIRGAAAAASAPADRVPSVAPVSQESAVIPDHFAS
ncbi:unnamed protein product, partial [Prorocentrum cordatum]